MFVKGHFLQGRSLQGLESRSFGIQESPILAPRTFTRWSSSLAGTLQGENLQDTCLLALHRAVEVLGEGHSLTEGLRSPNPGAVTWVTPDCA